MPVSEDALAGAMIEADFYLCATAFLKAPAKPARPDPALPKPTARFRRKKAR